MLLEALLEFPVTQTPGCTNWGFTFFRFALGPFRLSSHWIWGKLRYHALYDLGIMETAIGLVFGRGVLGRWCSFYALGWLVCLLFRNRRNRAFSWYLVFLSWSS
jgi:hypothetical protein